MLNIDSILQKVADQNHVTVEEVRKEISQSIKVAMSNQDQDIQNKWETIPKANEEPTPEELITYLLQRIQKEY